MATLREPAHAALWGSDHPALGSVAVTGVDGEAAVALSAGLHPKPYPHLDPNEDAVLAAIGWRCRLLAVADGHNGFDAAAGALRGLRRELDRLDAVGEPDAALDAFADAALLGVREALKRADPDHRRSRTALSLLISVGGRVHVRQWGDTAALHVRASKARLLASPAPFLSPQGEQPRRATVAVRPDDLIIAASDGLSTYLGNGWVRRVGAMVAGVPDLEEAVRGLVDAAFTGGAGDHVGLGIMVAGPRPQPA